MDYTIIQENSELRAHSRKQLDGIWGQMAAVYLIYLFLAPIAASIAAGPFLLGFAGFFLKRIRGEEIALENIFDGFKRFWASFLAMFLSALFVALWSLLLIIPGIIKAFSYSMTFYIMYDNPEMSPLEAINKSKLMMNGYKLKLFTLELSFVGWAFLCVLTLGIGFLWLYPYIQLSMGNFYENLKKSQEKLLVLIEETE